MNGETQCARFFGSPGPAEPENLAHLLLPSLHHSNGKAKCAGMGGTPRSAPTPIKNALYTKRRFHSKSGPDFSIFARSLLLPTPNERRDQMCQVFGPPGPAQPENLAHLLLPFLHHSNGKAKCAGMGTPRSAPTPIKNALFTKRIYHSKSGPDFSIFARSLLLPTPNERRDQMCPKTWHICSFAPCTAATARPHLPEGGEPRDRPRPQSKTGARKPGTFAPSLLRLRLRRRRLLLVITSTATTTTTTATPTTIPATILLPLLLPLLLLLLLLLLPRRQVPTGTSTVEYKLLVE